MAKPTKLPLDDIIKSALKQVLKTMGKSNSAVSRYKVMRGPLNRNVKDSIKGAAKKDNVVLNMYANQYEKGPKTRLTADQRIRMRERDENIRANINRVEGAPRIKKGPQRG